MSQPSEARQILSSLWRGGNYAYLWTDNGKVSKWFGVDEATTIPSAWKNSNVYFSIHPVASIPALNSRGETVSPERVRSQIKLIAAINCVFGEFDAKDEVSTREYAPFLPDDYDSLTTIAQQAAIKTAKADAANADLCTYKARAMARIKKSPMPPTLLIDSGGGYHVYWILADTVFVSDENRIHIQEVQAGWVDLVGCDPVSKDIARVLRVPGTKNVKPQYAPNFPTVTIVEYEPLRLYNFEEIERLTGMDEIAIAARRARQKTKAADKSGTDDDVIEEFNRTHHIVDLLVDEGYTLAWEKANVARLARPGRDKGQTSVIVFKDGEKELSYHHSSSDPLYTIGHCRDAFDIATATKYKADPKRAYELVKREQGKWQEAKQTIDTATGEILPAEMVTITAHDHKNGTGDTPSKSKEPKTASAAPKSDEYLEVLNDLGYRFEMNQLDDRIEVNGLPISDGIQAEIRTKMRDMGYNKIPAFEDAYIAHAYRQGYHPVKRYLDGLEWHGTDYISLVSSRIESNDRPITYADGSTATVFHAYFKRWLIGAIERALGGKQHPMLVMVSGQGTGKSQFVRWLGSGLPDLFNEGAIKPDNKEHDRLLAIKWIWEVGELGATTKRQDVEALKDFLTRQGVTFRVPYLKNPVTKPSLASFIGTVNPSAGFLTDVTGNRRFMICDVTSIDWSYSKLDVNQLWAQAYQLYKDGERTELSPEEADRQVESNKDHLVEDPYEGWIRRYCDLDPLREDWTQTTTELTALLQDQGVRGETRAIQMRLSDTLKGMELRQHANARPRRWVGIKIKEYFGK